MTKEELEKEADDYAEKHAFRVPYDGSNKFYDDVDFKASKEGYLAGAKPREKRIAELNNFIMQSKEDGISPINALIIATLGERITELEEQIEKVKHYLDNEIPLDFINEATTKIWRMLK